MYFAYCIPYTYSDLLDDLRTLKDQSLMQETKLGVSLGGLDIPLLTITDFKDPSAPAIEERFLVLVNSRIHPGETNGSYVCLGLIKYLLS